MMTEARSTAYRAIYNTPNLDPASALPEIMRQLIDLSPHLRFRLETGLAEILNNIVMHGGAGKGPACAVHVAGNGSRLSCAIRDSGASAPLNFYRDPPPERHFEAILNLDDLPESGFGRGLIHRCFDDIQYRASDVGNVLLLEMILDEER